MSTLKHSEDDLLQDDPDAGGSFHAGTAIEIMRKIQEYGACKNLRLKL